MLAALITGILAVIVGIGAVVKASWDHKDDSCWFLGVMMGCVLIAVGIFGISSFGNDMGNRADPPSPITNQGHIYRVINSMKFKKGYLVSFYEMIPNVGEVQVRFFKEVPPRFFESARADGKEIYETFIFAPSDPNPVN